MLKSMCLYEGRDCERQRKREPSNSLPDSQADSAQDEQGLVAESAGSLDSPRALSRRRSDGQGFQLRGGVQET